MSLGFWLKIGPYVVIALLLGYIGWLKYEDTRRDLSEARAVIKYRDKAEALANELVIQEAIAMGATTRIAGDAKEKIRNVQLPPNELTCEPICAASERQRLGTRGVRDTLYSSPAADPGGAPTGLPGPKANPR